MLPFSGLSDGKVSVVSLMYHAGYLPQPLRQEVIKKVCETKIVFHDFGAGDKVTPKSWVPWSQSGSQKPHIALLQYCQPADVLSKALERSGLLKISPPMP